MKKFIIFVMSLFIGIGAQAQENVSIGPIAGLSMASLRGDISDVQWNPGLTVGAFYNYSTKTNFGFSGQVLYTQMGAQRFNKTQEINLNYLQVPLLATYFLGRYGQRVRPKIFAGPNLNFLLNAKNENGDNINGDSNNRVYNPFDLGLTFGAGFNYRLSQKIWLNVDARYGLGLLDIAKNDAVNLKNHQWGIHAGVSFPLGTYNSNTGRLR
ncbi:porin family protein [Dyadobacter tibetensis]|uniref:porin family protein n=1 Tax=Dyadobacter tibetensis TaxID=1211851 RepID=UPI00046F71F8|nr:porin family protein [Dyadobacter tibetensis]